jgi:predicted anti-sigma-YlaC factor YlaD
MNCTQSREWLQHRLDGAPMQDSSDLEQHLRTCRECRRLFAAAVRLEEGLRVLPSPAPPGGFAKVTVSRAVADRRRLLRRRWLAGAVVAASLLVALAVGYYSQPQSGTQGAGQPEPTQPATPPAALVKNEPSAPSLRASMMEVGTAVVTLTRRTADETIGQTRILTEALPMPMNVFEAIPPAPEQPILAVWQGTGQRMATGLEPVTTSARRALTMFLRESPLAVNQ